MCVHHTDVGAGFQLPENRWKRASPNGALLVRGLRSTVLTWAPPLSLFLCLRECYRFSTTGSLPLKIAPDHLTIGKSKHETQFSPLTVSEQGRDEELSWPSSSRELIMFVAANTRCLDLYQ